MPPRLTCQFSLRALLIATFVIALIVAFVPRGVGQLGFILMLAWMSHVFWVSVTLVCAAAFVGGNWMRLLTRDPSRNLSTRLAVYSCLIPSVLAAAYLLWARERAFVFWQDPQWPCPPPYPDGALEWYGVWVFDTWYPPPPTEPGFVGRSFTTSYRIMLWTTEGLCYLSVALAAFIFGFLLRADWLWRSYGRARNWIASWWPLPSAQA